jgi:hypothetical protein
LSPTHQGDLKPSDQFRLYNRLHPIQAFVIHIVIHIQTGTAAAAGITTKTIG